MPKRDRPRKEGTTEKGGRPPKITAAFLKELETLLLGGVNPRTAVLSLGISGDSWTRWREKGQPDGLGNYPNNLYGRFCGLVDRASAVARAGVDVAVHKSAKAGDMGAARLYYQRVRAENFEPHNLKGDLPPGDVDDDNDSLLTALATRVAGLVKAGGAGEVPSGS